MKEGVIISNMKRGGYDIRSLVWSCDENECHDDELRFRYIGYMLKYSYVDLLGEVSRSTFLSHGPLSEISVTP
jgi:hypothetical protein